MSQNFSRRNFLLSSAAAAAGGALPGGTALGQKKSADRGKSPIRLGLASYTFRNFDRAQLIQFMRQLKLDQLNAKNVKDHLPSEPTQETQAVQAYTAAGIHLHAAGTIYFKTSDDAGIRAAFEYCKRAGVPVMVAGDTPPNLLPNVERFVKEYDIRFAIHNHGPEDKIWPSPLTVLKAVKNMDPRMGCCIDVGHTVSTGTNVVEAMRAAGPRLFNVHMKDLADFSNENTSVPVGEGRMPVREIFETLIQMRYPGYVDLEYETDPENPMPGVAASFAYMRGVLAGMGYVSS
jgi:hypothetical protein